MKKPYRAPRLKYFGPISVLTEANGYASDQDYIYVSGRPLDGFQDGSTDVNIDCGD